MIRKSSNQQGECGSGILGTGQVLLQSIADVVDPFMAIVLLHGDIHFAWVSIRRGR